MTQINIERPKCNFRLMKEKKNSPYTVIMFANYIFNELVVLIQSHSTSFTNYIVNGMVYI